MLRRDRQIRTQTSQLADACLVALSFWLAYLLRANPAITAWLNLGVIPPDSFNNINNVLIAFALIPITPMILEGQGFYNRQIFGPRGDILWPLLQGCTITTIGLILVGFVLHLDLPRWVAVWFGAISFALIYGKEEMLRLAFRSRFAQGQYKRRFILVGTETETVRMCRELESRKDETVAVIAQFDLSKPIPQLVQMLHDHAAYGVILSGKHTYFEQIESIIKVCELEGVEVWLLADFFTTQISRTSFDELLGRPLLPALLRFSLPRFELLLTLGPPLLQELLLFGAPLLDLLLHLLAPRRLYARWLRAGLRCALSSAGFRCGPQVRGL